MKKILLALIAACCGLAHAANGVVNTTGSAVTVPQSGDTLVLIIDTLLARRIFVRCDVASNALDAFIIKGRRSVDSTATQLYSAAGDYTTPTGALVWASGDLTAQAVGSGAFLMDTIGIEEITLYASSGNAAGSTVTCYAGGF